MHNRNTSIPEKYERIWDAVRRIPRGRVSTYGVIAAIAGMEGQPRLVGYALHQLPEGSGVPWHRVINARGEISISSRRSSARVQRSLLIREGVRFTGKRIDLRKRGWPGDSYR